MDMKIDKDAIQKGVIERITEEMLDRVDWHDVIRGMLQEKVDASYSTAVEKNIDEIVDKAIKSGFEHEYHKTNGLGLPMGDKTSIGAELEKLIGRYWTEKVSSNGKPSDSSFHTTTRAEWLMLQICGDKFTEQMKQQVVNVTGDLKDNLRGVLRQQTDNMVKDLFRVRTKDDQAERFP